MGMTATDELRRLLDERGVEYFESPNGIAWGERSSAVYGFRYMHYAVELDGLLCVSSHRITPEQAIAATLGNDGVGGSNDGVAERGTCHMVKHEMDVSAWNAGLAEDDPERIVSAYYWECSECGEKLEESWHYCPNCGAKVIE